MNQPSESGCDSDHPHQTLPHPKAKSKEVTVTQRPTVEEEDSFGNDPYFAKDAFFQDNLVLDKAERSRIVHDRKCPVRRRDPVKDVLNMIFVNKSNVTISANFITRRPSHDLCHCEDWMYDISLRNKTLNCHGCGRPIRSSGHVCKSKAGVWLSKKTAREFDGVRQRNFQSLAKHLPYVLPNTVLVSALETTPKCQSVVFLDRQL